MKKDEPKTVSLNEFNVCEMDSKEFSKIFSKQITGELDCLNNNLDLFIKIVKTDKPGKLSFVEVKNYVKLHMPDLKEGLIDVLEGIFELNSILTGDESRYIQKENVQKLIKLFKTLNETMASQSVIAFFSDKSTVTLAEHNRRKSIVYSSFLKVSKALEEIVSDNTREIDIISLLKKFETIDNKDILKNAEILLFIKKAFLGGNEKTLTSRELQRLVKIIPDFSKVLFDLANIHNTNYEKDDEAILKVVEEGKTTLVKTFFYKNKPQEPVVTITQVQELIKTFYPKAYKFFKYKKSILKAKEILFGNNSEIFYASDMKILFNDIIGKNAAKGSFFYRAYNNNLTLMERVSKIYRNFIDVFALTEEEKKNRDDFTRVVRNYRFYKGGNFSPVFSHDFKRNPRGVFLIGLMEDIIGRVYKFYGTPNQNVSGGYTLSQKELVTVMTDFSAILEGEGLILPGRSTGTAETITLMTNLFHPQSSGDALISIPEFTEFINTMLTSLNLANVMHDELKKRCELDQLGRYTPQCYRDHFVDILNVEKEGKRLGDYVPNLETYLKGLSEKKAKEYFVQTAQFSRACSKYKDGTEVPMKSGDAIVSWAGLLAVEQTMIRYDLDASNILEYKEVDKAYEIFRGAIKGMIPVNFLKKYSKTFYQYLVKYRRVPDVQNLNSMSGIWRAMKQGSHFVKFMFKDYSDKKAPADRMTFASVLKIIAKNSPANKKTPYNCEILRPDYKPASKSFSRILKYNAVDNRQDQKILYTP